ncbi:MAG: glycosyltransferase [Rhizobiales bacterium]|nr:glycosyltransferase [Hyphomicrobiales bacterium]MBI3672823.1 glycosyltransferase [Hyphomicrobiales bacterium]
MTESHPQVLDKVTGASIVASAKFDSLRSFVDLAIATEGGYAVVIGWIFDPLDKSRGMARLSPGDGKAWGGDTEARFGWLSKGLKRNGRDHRQFIRHPLVHGVDGTQLVRVERSDVSAAMNQTPGAGRDMHGFILTTPVPPSEEPVLAIELTDDRYVLLNCRWVRTPGDIVAGLRQVSSLPQSTLLAAVRAGLGDEHPLFALVRDMPAESQLASSGASPVKSVFARVVKRAQGRMGAVLNDLSQLPTNIEKPETVLVSIDRGYPLGQAGFLFFGWYLTPKQRPKGISVCDEFGNQVQVADRMAPISRLDVVSAYRSRFHNVDEMCGFVCLAPIPTYGGEPRALCFDFGEFGETWLKIPSDKTASEGLTLAKDMLGVIADPARVRTRLFEIFDTSLGKAIETVIAARPPVKKRIDILQFGTAPAEPRYSVIVPLYGRCDFVRHQLAHFADDPDFRTAELIYVVDDPAIITEALDLAARYHEVFGVPLRLVWYGENRGYAGANNIGADLARGQDMVLLNSDVLPQHGGWLAILARALEKLPAAGAVGPLLQFGDGSIQHAGMYPKTDATWPGFLLNSHRHMGIAWTGGDGPSEHPMLTAACLMLRTADYRALGGFDENYVIGDFEDSDLCLRLRRYGKRLYLVPEAKLWHLERQSQNLDGLAGNRQMITLYNAWRYMTKIRKGGLVDPRTVEIGR